LSGVIVLLGAAAASHARPVVIEESASFTSPLPQEFPRFGYKVATNGEYALVNGFREEPSPSESWVYGALLFRRVNGEWQFDRVLEQYQHFVDSYSFPVNFAMKGNLAAVALAGHHRIYALESGTWVRQDFSGDYTEDLETDGVRVLAGVNGWDGLVAERDAGGIWRSATLAGQNRCCDDEFWGGPVDIDGDNAVLGTPYPYDLEAQEIPVYLRASTGWLLRGKIQVPDGVYRLGDSVGLRGNHVFVNHFTGPFIWNVFYLTSPPIGRLQSLDAYTLGGGGGGTIEKSGDHVFIMKGSPDRREGVIEVFRALVNGSEPYEHVATLVTKDRTQIGGSFDVAGRTVMAGGVGTVHVWELPESFATPPTPRYDDFESGSGAVWNASAGSQFAIVQSNAASGQVNRVYRQSSAAGDAQAVLSGDSWGDQAIEADIRPTFFNTADRWVGLATRYADAQNYYYVTLRASGSVQLKRMVGGGYTTLATAPLAVAANRTYRVRLESIGSAHRVYVDGRLLADVRDSAGSRTGNAALLMYQARADFDNVIVAPSARTTMFANDFASEEGDWSFTASGQWNRTSAGTFAQNSIGGDARAAIGTATDDQVVATRLRVTAFAPPAGSQERWIGLSARYRDTGNYYYVSLRSGNTLQLRRLQAGQITTLGSIPVTVTPGAWHALRFEAVGDALRVWLNGALVLQVRDSTHQAGRSGVVTFKAAGEYDDFVAYQP
jgi:hypothetical protein